MDDTKEDNPWQVNQLEEFLYFCCPRCDSKCQAKEIFLDHALIEHPESSEFLEQFQLKEVPYDALTIKQENTDEELLDGGEEFLDAGEEFLDGGEETFNDNHEDLKDQVKEVQCYKCSEVMQQDEIESHIFLVHDGDSVEGDYGQVRDFQCALCHRALATKRQSHKCVAKKNKKENTQEKKENVQEKKENTQKKEEDSQEAKERYKCKLCDNSYRDKYGLKYHMEVHENKEWWCKKCDFVTNQRRNLRAHELREHLKKKEYQKHYCVHCAKEFRHKGNCMDHEARCLKMEESTEKVFKCEECEFVFKGEVAYKLHLHNKHKDASKEIACEFCGNLFSSQKCYLRHKREYHPTKADFDKVKCICTNCKQSFKSAVELNDHLKDCLVNASGDIVCCFCDKSDGWYSMIAVKKHCAEEHQKHMIGCEECRLTFTTHHFSEQHKKSVHRKKATHPCPVCNEVFNLKKTLNQHKFKVHGDRSVTHYKCDQCDYVTSFHLNLKEHVNALHTKEILYKCPYCDFTNYRKGVFKSHVASVHEKRQNFKCDTCSKGFFNNRELLKHKLSVGH